MPRHAEASDRRLGVLLGLGALIAVVGNYLTRVQPNWFMGIRTPWTLSSDVVWRKTHRVVGGVMVGAGLAIVAASFFPSAHAGVVAGATLAGVALFALLFSLFLWMKERPRNRVGSP